MKIDIIKGRPLKSGTKPLYCKECDPTQKVHADVVMFIADRVVLCCTKHLRQFTAVLQQAQASL